MGVAALPPPLSDSIKGRPLAEQISNTDYTPSAADPLSIVYTVVVRGSLGAFWLPLFDVISTYKSGRPNNNTKSSFTETEATAGLLTNTPLHAA